MSKYTAQDYLQEYINYGGYAVRRGIAMQDMKERGFSHREIDQYMFYVDDLDQDEIDLLIPEEEFRDG